MRVDRMAAAMYNIVVDSVFGIRMLVDAARRKEAGIVGLIFGKQRGRRNRLRLIVQITLLQDRMPGGQNILLLGTLDGAARDRRTTSISIPGPGVAEPE